MVVDPPRRLTTISRAGKRSGWCLEGGRGPNHFSNWLHCPFGVSRSVGLERAVNSTAQPFPNSSTIIERRRSDWLWTSVGARFGFIWGRTLGRRKRLRWARHDKHNGVTMCRNCVPIFFYTVLMMDGQSWVYFFHPTRPPPHLQNTTPKQTVFICYTAFIFYFSKR